MTTDTPLTPDTEQAEPSIFDERPIIKEDNKYHTRGCCFMPTLDDPSRSLQMVCCAKLATFDWTKGLAKDDDTSYHVIEVRFKNSHKDFYKIVERTDVLKVGDIVVVEAAAGHDVGVITLTGPGTRIFKSSWICGSVVR